MCCSQRQRWKPDGRDAQRLGAEHESAAPPPLQEGAPADKPAPAKADEMGVGSTTADSDSSEPEAANAGEESANDNQPAEELPATGERKRESQSDRPAFAASRTPSPCSCRTDLPDVNAGVILHRGPERYCISLERMKRRLPPSTGTASTAASFTKCGTGKTTVATSCICSSRWSLTDFVRWEACGARG